MFNVVDLVTCKILLNRSVICPNKAIVQEMLPLIYLCNLQIQLKSFLCIRVHFFPQESPTLKNEGLNDMTCHAMASLRFEELQIFQRKLLSSPSSPVMCDVNIYSLNKRIIIF